MGAAGGAEQGVAQDKSLAGKVAIVTGANSGLGKETAKFLAGKGATVILGCRSADRGRDAAVEIREAVPGAQVEPMLLDLKKLDSVREFADKFKQKQQHLNILVNNAGALLSRESYSEEGVCSSAQVNFLGPYTLTRLLEKELVRGAPSKVVNVSSVMHRLANIESADKFLHSFRHAGYSNTKLANVLFTHELQRRWGDKGIESAAVDPGSVWTNVWRGSIYARPPVSWLLQSIYGPPEDGAVAVNFAATAPPRPRTARSAGRGAQGAFYAKGLFAAPLLTSHPMSSRVPSLGGLERALYTGPVALCVSLLDWPMRWMSRGYLASQVRAVRPAPTSLDPELAADLWERAAKISGLQAEDAQKKVKS